MEDFTIHDRTPDVELFPDDKGRGLELPEGFQGPGDYRGVASPFPRELVLSWEEIKDRISLRERTKARHRDVADGYDLKCKDQKQTNFCWANSPVYCLEYVRVMDGMPPVELSPASVGGPVTGFRNVGGYGRNALRQLEENGAVPTEFWPDNAISSSYYTSANRELAKLYRTSEWWVFEPRDLQAVASCVVGLGIPVSGGFNWWAHQVTYTDFYVKGEDVWPWLRNSWGMSYGDRGYFKLEGSRAFADDAVAPAVAYAA